MAKVMTWERLIEFVDKRVPAKIRGKPVDISALPIADALYVEEKRPLWKKALDPISSGSAYITVSRERGKYTVESYDKIANKFARKITKDLKAKGVSAKLLEVV